MSRKTTSSDNFVPSKGIREDVLHHQLSSTFGKGATYRKSTTREGWVISNGNKVTKDRIKQLRLDTDLVNATREREVAQAEQLRRERPRQDLPVGNRGAPVLPDSERVSQETFARERAQARHQDHPDTSIQHRTASSASRYPPERQSSYQEITLRAQNPAPYVQPRDDGYSQRSSSLQVNNTAPIQIPSNPDRHHESSGYGKSYNDVGSVQSGSFIQGPTIPRHGNHGTQDPSIAARDTSRHYEEDEFRNFLESQQYKKFREKADAEVLSQRRRRQSEDESSDDEMGARLSRISLGPATAAKATHRHSDRNSRGGTVASQNIRANAKIESAKSSRRMQDVEEDSESGSEVLKRDSSPDSTIGHQRRHQATKAEPTNAGDSRARVPINPLNERHRDVRPDPRQDFTSASRDLAPATRQASHGADTRSRTVQNYALSASKASSQSKGAYDDEDARRPRSQREESFYDDGQKKKKRHAEPEAPYITPNTGRRRDRGYVPGSDRSY